MAGPSSCRRLEDIPLEQLEPRVKGGPSADPQMEMMISDGHRGGDHLVRGRVLNYTDQPQQQPQTTAVIPEEEGPSVTRSSGSFRRPATLSSTASMLTMGGQNSRKVRTIPRECPILLSQTDFSHPSSHSRISSLCHQRSTITDSITATCSQLTTVTSLGSYTPTLSTSVA